MEALNPKTALFFLAFIPQFVDPAGPVFVQFVLLGFITTLLTSGADMIVVLTSNSLRGLLERHRRLQRVTSGGLLIGLGLYVVADT